MYDHYTPEDIAGKLARLEDKVDVLGGELAVLCDMIARGATISSDAREFAANLRNQLLASND